MIAAAYSAALSLAGPLLRLRLAWRARSEPLYGEQVDERFGRYDPAALAELIRWRSIPGPRLWLHAVSLGETRAATALVTALRARRPGLRILWTHGTATGRSAGAEMLGPGDLQLWQPFDTPGAVRRFHDAAAPTAGVLMETEIWPNLCAEARRRGMPLVLANARLSARSLRSGQRWSALLQPAVAGLSCVLAQTEEDAERLVQAGADRRRLQVAGNLKFDVSPPPQQLALGRTWKRALQRPVVMMASSREGEEAALLQSWMASLGTMSGPASATRPLLLLVPRHPQRFDAVAALVSAAGLRGVRRSRFGEAMPVRSDLDADVWIGDSLGEMPAYYGLSDVALLGGSFAPLGGQNLIEAAACACPVLMGPHTFNFADAAQGAVAAGAALEVPDLPAAVAEALAWLVDPGTEGRRRAGLAFAARHRGAALRMAAAIDVFLAPPDPGAARAPASLSSEPADR